MGRRRRGEEEAEHGHGTVNSPIQCSYHLPTTPRPPPPSGPGAREDRTREDNGEPVGESERDHRGDETERKRASSGEDRSGARVIAGGGGGRTYIGGRTKPYSPAGSTFENPLPPTAHGAADVPCLTGKLNRYFTVSYPLQRERCTTPEPPQRQSSSDRRHRLSLSCPVLTLGRGGDRRGYRPSPSRAASLHPRSSPPQMRTPFPHARSPSSPPCAVADAGSFSSTRSGRLRPSHRRSTFNGSSAKKPPRHPRPRRAPLRVATLVGNCGNCAGCKYPSAYCITRHDNVDRPTSKTPARSPPPRPPHPRVLFFNPRSSFDYFYFIYLPFSSPPPRPPSRSSTLPRPAILFPARSPPCRGGFPEAGVHHRLVSFFIDARRAIRRETSHSFFHRPGEMSPRPLALSALRPPRRGRTFTLTRTISLL